jgi:hypothetical protein
MLQRVEAPSSVGFGRVFQSLQNILSRKQTIVNHFYDSSHRRSGRTSYHQPQIETRCGQPRRLPTRQAVLFRWMQNPNTPEIAL